MSDQGVGAGISETAWIDQVLSDVGAPQTSQNVADMATWMEHEEPQSDWFDRNNPLNASLGTSSTDGTGSYANLNISAEETAAMINQTNMAPIKAALTSGSTSVEDFGSAVESSPWASSHYGYSDWGTGTTVSSAIAAGEAALGAGATLGADSQDYQAEASNAGLLNRSMLVRIGIGGFAAILALIALNAMTREKSSAPIDVITTGTQATTAQARTVHAKATAKPATPAHLPIQPHHQAHAASSRGTEAQKGGGAVKDAAKGAEDVGEAAALA